MAQEYRLGWFSTARGKGSRDLLKAVQDSIGHGEIKANISFVFCSREPGESEQTDIFFQQVNSYHIPLVCYSYQKFKAGRKGRVSGDLAEWRLDYDREVMRRLVKFKQPDLCVLAGYMLIVGKELCRKYDMLNLHPAAPGGPTGTWQEVIWKLIETGAERTGVMMHLVTPELDKGPVVAHCTFSIRGEPFDRYWREVEGLRIGDIQKAQGENNELFKLIRRHGVIRELPLVTTTIKAFSEGKIKITPDKTVVDRAGQPIKGYDLTPEIDKQVAGQS